MNIALRICLFVALAIAGCRVGSAQPTYGENWNSEREKRGIHKIPANAKRRETGTSNSETWFIPRSKDVYPLWEGKDIETLAGKIVMEEDIFYGPLYSDLADGQLHSRLLVAYDYRREAKGENPWLINIKDGENVTGKELSLEDAIGILKKWGLIY